MGAAATTENHPRKKWQAILWLRSISDLQKREEQLFLLLSLLIGALTGLAVVAFIVVTERLGMRLYPVGSAAWRRVLIPVTGSLAMGFLLYRYFPNARGSGVPQTKPPSSLGMGSSPCAPFWASSSAQRPPLQAESPWVARDHPSR